MRFIIGRVTWNINLAATEVDGITGEPLYTVVTLQLRC